MMFSWLRRKGRTAQRLGQEALTRVLDAMTAKQVHQIVTTTGAHVARVMEVGGYGRETDLPFPRQLIELAFFKGIVTCGDEKYRDLMISVYRMLDDVMLSDDEHPLMAEGSAAILGVNDPEWRERITTDAEAVKYLTRHRFSQFVEISNRLAIERSERCKWVDKVLDCEASGKPTRPIPPPLAGSYLPDSDYLPPSKVRRPWSGPRVLGSSERRLR